MNFGEILWLFFMLSALQPVVRQKMLEAARLRLLSRMERARKSRVIAMPDQPSPANMAIPRPTKRSTARNSARGRSAPSTTCGTAR